MADPREHGMATRADIHFRPKPGSDLALRAFSRYMFDHGYAKTDFIAQHVNNVEEYRNSLEPFTMEFAPKQCNVSIDTLTAAVAEEIAHAETMCVLWAMGITQHVMGSDSSTAISNLLLTTGNYMKPSCGAYPLRGHNNVQGASDMGGMQNNFPGYQSVTNDEVCSKFEKTWSAASPAKVCLDNHQMVGGVYAGTLRAMCLAGKT